MRASRAIDGVLQHAVRVFVAGCERRASKRRERAARVASRGENALQLMRCCAVSAEKMRDERASLALYSAPSRTLKSVVNRILSEFDDLVRPRRRGRSRHRSVGDAM